MSNTLITVILGAYLVGFIGIGIFMYCTMTIERILDKRAEYLEHWTEFYGEQFWALEKRAKNLEEWKEQFEEQFWKLYVDFYQEKEKN